MHTIAATFWSVAEGVWRRRWLAIASGWVLWIVSAAVIPLVPERYEAKALIYVDTQSVLKPLMAGLAYQPDIDQQVRMLARTVISRPNIEALVDRPELGMSRLSHTEREATIASLMKQIKLSPGESGLYTISYRDTQPDRAQRTVEAVLDLFVNLSSQVKKRDSEDASRFISEQIASYESKLAEAEGRLKEFRIRHMGVLGMSNQDFFARMSGNAEQLDKLQRDLSAAEQARDTYRKALAVENPKLTEIETALAAAKKQLDELQRHFTDEHPDVASTRDLIARIEARRAKEMELRSETDRPAPPGPSNERLRSSLADAEAQVASLRSRAAAEQQRLEQMRSVAGKVPQVDAELAQLNRDYEVIRKNYEQLVTRRESATLGVKLDESSRLADYRVVEPPRVADTPAFPGRVALALIAILASLAAAALVPVILDRLQPTFSDVRALQELTGRPVMGTVTVSSGNAAKAGRFMAPIGFALSFLFMMTAQLAWLAWIAKLPLV